MKYVFVILFLFPVLAYGQVTEYALDLKVVEVTSDAIEDVAFATIFIKESNQEIMTDKSGLVNLKLNPGVYTLYISSLGLEEKEVTIKVDGNKFNLVQLQPEGTSLGSLSSLESTSNRNLN